MADVDRETLLRLAAFEHVRKIGETHDHLTVTELKPGFVVEGERVPLMNPQRGIFKPQQMRFLLSIKTVFPRPGARVWYDDQRELYRQIFEADETVDYAFMGQDPDAADARGRDAGRRGHGGGPGGPDRLRARCLRSGHRRHSPRRRCGADPHYTPSTTRRKARTLDTQARYARWQTAYRALKQRRPQMSNVWYARQLAKQTVAAGCQADTIRRHMTGRPGAVTRRS